MNLEGEFIVIATVLLVAARLAGMLLLSPIFQFASVPATVRLLFVFVLAAGIVASVQIPAVNLPATLGDLGRALLTEVFLGALQLRAAAGFWKVTPSHFLGGWGCFSWKSAGLWGRWPVVPAGWCRVVPTRKGPPEEDATSKGPRIGHGLTARGVAQRPVSGAILRGSLPRAPAGRPARGSVYGGGEAAVKGSRNFPARIASSRAMASSAASGPRALETRKPWNR